MGQAVMDIKKIPVAGTTGKGHREMTKIHLEKHSPRYIYKKHSINMEILQAF